MIFAQVVQFISNKNFTRCVQHYDSERYIKPFINQNMSKAFVQLTDGEGLRDIKRCIQAHQTKLYHMGMRRTISHSTMAHANQHYDWPIWTEIAPNLTSKARNVYRTDIFRGGLA